MAETILYTKASGKAIERLVGLIEEAMDGENEEHIVMACIATALGLQCPGMDFKQLAAGIKGASEWIATYASSIDGPQGLPN